MDDSTSGERVRQLVEQHYETLYRFAYRLSGSKADADDLVQETFCTAQQKIGQLRNPGCSRAWLFRILRNHYLQRCRAPGMAIESLDALALDPRIPAEECSDVDGERLQAALNDLPEVFRTPVILFYFEDCSYREIADQLGVPIGTVMSRLARAKAYLRYCLLPRSAVPERLNPSVPGVS